MCCRVKLHDCEIPHQAKKEGLTNSITVTTKEDCIFTSVTTNRCKQILQDVQAAVCHRHCLALQEAKPKGREKRRSAQCYHRKSHHRATSVQFISTDTVLNAEELGKCCGIATYVFGPSLQEILPTYYTNGC